MRILSDQPAIHYSSFQLSANLKTIIEFESVDDLASFSSKEPLLVIGEGSNTVFLDDLSIPVCRYIAKQKQQIWLDDNYCLLHVEAGHNWHDLVTWTVDQQLWGLENLALIPGSVGAAPVQNIGAYGVELADRCLYVDFFEWKSRTIKRITAARCQFGYRDSIFKRELSGQGMIVSVGLLLQKVAAPVLNYHGLNHLAADSAVVDVYQQVIAVRRSKLPSPEELPNCGSFFKNPVLSADHYYQLQQQFSEIPGFQQQDGMVKVPAAWFIDQLGFKGCCRGDVGCYIKQPLVLVNYGHGTAEQLLALKNEIQHKALVTFNVSLEAEVRLIGSDGHHHV